MTEIELYSAFEQIHPSHRQLTTEKQMGKATHWLKLMTVPEQDMLSIPLAYFELGHGSAGALVNFLLAAMEFARERYARESCI